MGFMLQQLFYVRTSELIIWRHVLNKNKFSCVFYAYALWSEIDILNYQQHLFITGDTKTENKIYAYCVRIKLYYTTTVGFKKS